MSAYKVKKWKTTLQVFFRIGLCLSEFIASVEWLRFQILLRMVEVNHYNIGLSKVTTAMRRERGQSTAEGKQCCWPSFKSQIYFTWIWLIILKKINDQSICFIKMDGVAGLYIPAALQESGTTFFVDLPSGCSRHNNKSHKNYSIDLQQQPWKVSYGRAMFQARR